MSSPFIFKQFRLEQSQSAFKLGTDSVLLGGWLPDKGYKNILDIGGGTGIISLMMAQRFQSATIFSVEIDTGSYLDKANNFTQSPWASRLRSIHADIFEWSGQNPEEKFDLIISNPPYFTNDLQNPDRRKANTRHTGVLNAQTMAQLVMKHISPTGNFACILPSQEFNNWMLLLRESGIYLNQVCDIRSFKSSEVVRNAGIFSLKEKELIREDQFIYNDDKSRSRWYSGITSEFYIK